MNKTIYVLSLIVLILAVSGCVQDDSSVRDAENADNHVEQGEVLTEGSEGPEGCQELGEDTVSGQISPIRNAPSELVLEKEYVESRVRDAAGFIEEGGEAVFPDFREKDSEWFQEDFYIFVWKTDGTRLVYPPDSSGEGKDMSGLLDPTGKPIGELFIETALSEAGEGWVSYSWPRPGEEEATLKYAFIKGVSMGGEEYLVGSGFYADDYIITSNLDECEYFSREGNIFITNVFHPDLYNRDVYIDYSIAHAIIRPGQAIAPHRMKNPELHYVLEGEGTIYIEALPVELRPGEMVYIPANATQSTHNTGDKNLSFFAINQPAWSVENEEILD